MGLARHWHDVRADLGYEGHIAKHPELRALCDRVADAGGVVEFWVGAQMRQSPQHAVLREDEAATLERFNASLPEGVRLVLLSEQSESESAELVGDAHGVGGDDLLEHATGEANRLVVGVEAAVVADARGSEGARHLDGDGAGDRKRELARTDGDGGIGPSELAGEDERHPRMDAPSSKNGNKLDRLRLDKVLRVSAVALEAVVAHAEAHSVGRYEAADTLILTGAAAEHALIEALEADAPEPSGELRTADRTFVALSEEALGVVDSWTIQGGHPDRAAATSDLVVRAGRRLASLVAWRKKQAPRRKTAGEAAR